MNITFYEVAFKTSIVTFSININVFSHLIENALCEFSPDASP